MPEGPLSKPLTPREATEHVFRKIEDLLALGVCENCAIRLMCAEYRLDYRRLLILWLDRDYGAAN